MNTTNNSNAKHAKSKKYSKGVEVHPSDNSQWKISEGPIQDIPIGFPVDKEKLKILKNKIKNDNEKTCDKIAFIQEDGN